MKFVEKLLVVLTGALSSHALAALDLVLEQDETHEFAYAKLVVLPDVAYWVTARPGATPSIQLQPFADTNPSRVKRVDSVPGAVLLSPVNVAGRGQRRVDAPATRSSTAFLFVESP